MVCIDKLTKLVRLVPYFVENGELTDPAIALLFFTRVVSSMECCALFYMITILGLQARFGKHSLIYI